jgi:thiamine monophosphate kinase
MLLDTVYSLNDASDGVSEDLEKLIASTVKQVEDMIDQHDKVMESWK